MPQHSADKNRPTRRQFLRSGLACAAGCAACSVFRGPGLSAQTLDSSRVRFTVLGERACRPCRLLIHRFIGRNRAELSRCFPDGAEVFFVLGKEPESIPARSIAIGNCTLCFRGKAALFVPGCPPTEPKVMEAILRSRREFERIERPEGKLAVLFG